MRWFSDARERSILESPATRKLVRDVLEATERCDILDAVRDVGTALRILEWRLEWCERNDKALRNEVAQSD